MVGAAVANLKNVALQLPLGRLTVVTGRSGAGKSSLVLGSLLPAVRATLQGGPVPETVCKEITGINFSRVITFDQSSLGSSPRSTPATYLGIWEVIRDLFAALPESRARGYKSGRFSFNVKGGRCESCKGEGVHRTALDLMADVAMLCPECGGARFNRETLLPKFRGLSVGDVLALSVDNAQRLFAHLPKVNAVLVQLQRLGLGYLTLGQASPTLSGGEAQRVRFALELSRQGDGQILYLFDEPTSGLHFSDVSKVVECLHSLLASGHTLVVVEHNQAVLDVADWIVELGPGPGPLGGEVSFCGPPRDWDRLPSRTR
jgi:excinuclease ABC subunit A